MCAGSRPFAGPSVCEPKKHLNQLYLYRGEAMPAGPNYLQLKEICHEYVFTYKYHKKSVLHNEIEECAEIRPLLMPPVLAFFTLLEWYVHSCFFVLFT